MKLKKLLCILLSVLMVFSTTSFSVFAEDTFTKGYMIYTYDADGNQLDSIDGTKSASEFNLATALSDFYVLIPFPMNTPSSIVIDAYEDSTSADVAEIKYDTTINTNGYTISNTYNIADGVTLTVDGNVYGAEETTAVAEVDGVGYETVLEALTAAMESTTEVEVKLLQDSTELLTTDFEFIVNADVTITADTPVTAAFYNNGTTYDLIFGSENNNTITIGENVTIRVNDRNIWLGYYGDRNATVKVCGTLSAGYQLWSGSDVEVYGTLESLGEALVLRRGKTLTVDGGKVDASYFSILAGNIDAKNGASIECGPVWISNNGNYAGEGNVEITLDNATLNSSGNIKSVTTHADGVSITIKDSTASFTGTEHGASNLDASTNVVVSGSSELNLKSLTNAGAIEVTDDAKVVATGSVVNNGTIKVEDPSGFDGTVEGAQPTTPAETVVATVDDEEFTDIQEAIKYAAPDKTVVLVDDVVVDEWIMFSERLSIGSGQIITIDEINGLTINGEGHSLTINGIESASNGNRLFYDATNLNVKNLTINYADGVVGGIGLTSGTISNVTFNGGVGVLPGDGEITITGCTFNTAGSAIYNEEERDNLVVTGNTFNTAEGQYAIYLRGNTTFTGNTVVSGKVNVVNGSPVVTGNDFGNERFKVYNGATATIENNTINVLAFHDDSEVKSTFADDNILSEDAQTVLDAAMAPAGPVEVTTYEELIEALAEDNANVIMMNDITATATQASSYGKAGIVLGTGDVLDGNGKTLTINGANSTWDCAIAMTGGEVKNLTIAGAMRGVFMPGANGDVVIDSCVFKDVIYTFNSDAGSKDYTVTIKNTTLNGWTSFSDVHKSVTFESCTFGEGSGYAFCRPYQATTFTNCTFAEGFALDTTETVDNNLAFNGCTYNGTALSAKNNAMFPDGGKVLIDGVSTDVTNYPPTGSNSYAYTKEVDGYVRVWGQSENTNAAESYVLKLYSDETLIATTVLNNVGNIIDGSQDSVTWNFFYPASNDEYWTTTWEESHPNSAAQPTEVELYIDGTLVATTDAKMSGADGVNPVVWGELGGVKKIVTDLSGSGTAEDPFLIDEINDLKWFRDDVNGGNKYEGEYVKLTAGIDLASENWTPIGNDTNYFMGTFDGGNNTISNMTINVNSTGNVFAGLFGGIKQATVKNLTLTNVDIDAVGAKVRAAAVVGIAHSGSVNSTVATINFENITVDGCTIDATATSGSALLGGVVGYSYPANMKNITVSDLTINGKAEGNEVRAAAINGYVCGQNISNNGNTRAPMLVDTFNVSDVTITAEGYTVFAGGYAPYTYYGYITLQNGSIDGLKITVDAHEAFVGGLVGYFWRSDNGHTVNNVDITNIDFDVTTDYLGETRIGGVVGTSQSPNTKYNDVTVSGKIVERCSDPANPVNYHAKVGGFVARTYEYALQTYTNCVADVDVIGSNIAGGFVGNHNSTVSYVNCEAKGDVTANTAGGFAGRVTEHGYTTDVTFDGCKAFGTVTGTNVAGGFIGSTANHGWAAWAAGNGTAYGKNITLKDCVAADVVTTTNNTGYCAGVVGEAKVADGKELTLDNVTFTVKPAVYPYIAKVGTTEYFTLQEAIDNANGAEVILVSDTTENITIADGATVVIDLGGKTLNGYIAPCKPTALTISNGSIKNSDSGYSAIEINAGTLAMTNVNIDSARHAVRIDGAVTAIIDGGTYKTVYVTNLTQHAVNVSGAANVIIKNGTFVGPKGTSSDSGAAVNVQTGATVSIKGGSYSGGKNNTLAAAGTLTVTGGTFDQDPSTYVAAGYKAVAADGGYTVVEDVTDVAELNGNKYPSLQAAINAAQNGDVITVLTDINLADCELQVLDGSHDTYFLVEGKSVTINLNGKTISGAYTGSRLIGVFSTDKNGHLTLTGNGTVTATGTVYALVVCFNNGSTITIENGTYELDEATNCLIYYGGETDAELTVNDGTFKLGNIDDENGPWIVNVYGAGDHHVLINGGTFNADINRQKWSNEAVVAETCYTVANADSTYTVKDGAKAYVSTGMTTGPYFVRKNIGYATLQEAIPAAVQYTDPHVTLLADYKSTLEITGEVKLHLNGHTINSDASTIVVNGGNLTIDNDKANTSNKVNEALTFATATTEGKIITTDTTGNGEAIAVKNGGKLTLNGGAVESGAYGIYVYTSGGTANINGGSVTIGGTNVDGMTVTVGSAAGSANISGGTFEANGVNWPMYAWDGTISITGGTFDFNPSSYYVAYGYAASEKVIGSETWYEVASIEPVAYIDNNGYYNIEKAIEAANDGDVITVNTFTHSGDLLIDKKVTLVAAEGATVQINGQLQIKADGVTVKGLKVNCGGTAVQINAKDILVENCELTGANGLYQSYTDGTVTFKDSTITGDTYGIHFDGSDGGNIVIDNCVITGWTSFAASLEKVTIKDSEFADGNYDTLRFYQNAEVTNTTFPAGMRIDSGDGGTGMAEIDLKFNDCSMADGSDFTNVFPESVIEASDVYVDGTLLGQVNVAKIGDTYYKTLAEALKDAADGATIELLWSEGDAPIAMNGYVSGKTVTITGTAQVDWEKGFLFVGRTNDGTAAADATLIFKDATLTTTQGGDHGIHVSGAENGSATKANGTVKMINSTINLSYLINKGDMTLDNSTLTVKSGFSIGGRPASETVSGADATATISLTNGSKVVVDNHNGMGLGYEAIGVMNVDKTSSFETTQSFLVTAKGTMNLAGTAKVAGTLTNNGSIVLTDAAATLTSSECGNVTTTDDGYKVKYADGKYALTKIELFKLSGSNVKIDSSLTMFFYIPKAELQGGVDYYATITKASADEEAIVLNVPMSEWEVYAEDNNLYRVAFDDLMAYMMNDEIKVQIFNEDDVAVSEIWTDSISYYAHRTYNNPSTDDLLKTALVDMLNYGAACQVEFGYDADNLANKNLTPEQQDMASGEPTLTNSRIKGDRYFGSSLTCDSTLVLQFYFTDINDTMTAKITYIDAYEDEITMEIDGAEFNKRSSDLTGVMVGLPAYDAQQLVKCEVFDGDTVVASASDSIESYVARMSATGEIYSTIMKFALSSKAALRKS